MRDEPRPFGSSSERTVAEAGLEGGEPDAQQRRLLVEIKAMCRLVAVPAALHLPFASDERPFLRAHDLGIGCGVDGRETKAAILASDKELVGAKLSDDATADWLIRPWRRLHFGPAGHIEIILTISDVNLPLAQNCGVSA